MFQVAVVDDDVDSRQMLCDFLDFNGFVSRPFESGRDFLKACQESRSELPHLVVSDVNMPYLSGIDMSETLRDKFPDLPIILISALPTPGDIQRAEKIGVRDYISKPFGLRKFRDAIREVLQA